MRGGAVVSGRGQLELRFAARQQLNLDEKRRIAARAVELIQPGSTIFLDGSGLNPRECRQNISRGAENISTYSTIFIIVSTHECWNY